MASASQALNRARGITPSDLPTSKGKLEDVGASSGASPAAGPDAGASQSNSPPETHQGAGTPKADGKSSADNGEATSSGIAYRADLPDHLFGPDGFTKGGQLSGTHNLDNAKSALDGIGANYQVGATDTKGIYEVKYRYTDSSTGKLVSGAKTCYDPQVYSDKTMLDLGQQAGSKGFQQYLSNPQQRVMDISQGGVKFRVYINFDKSGAAYVGNVHPVK